MRFIGEKPEQNAGGDWVSFQQNKRAADDAKMTQQNIALQEEIQR